MPAKPSQKHTLNTQISRKTLWTLLLRSITCCEPTRGEGWHPEIAQHGTWIPGLLPWVQGYGQLCHYVTEVDTNKQEMPLLYPGSWTLPWSVNGNLEGMGEGTTEKTQTGTATPAPGMFPRASQDETFTSSGREEVGYGQQKP